MSKARNNLLKETLEESEYLKRGQDIGLIGDNGSNISVRENGDTTIAINEFAQYKISSNGVSTEISIQSNTITNTKNIRADNIAINRHKLNPQLWELTDFKTSGGRDDKAIGNLTVSGTVLVKTFEPTLNRYVLIRRPIRTPLFSNLLDIPSAPNQSDVDINIGKDLKKYIIQESDK